MFGQPFLFGSIHFCPLPIWTNIGSNIPMARTTRFVKVISASGPLGEMIPGKSWLRDPRFLLGLLLYFSGFVALDPCRAMLLLGNDPSLG